MWKILPAVLILPSLLIFSTGCSTKHIPAPVDTELTRPIDRPALTDGATWRDMAESYVLRGESLDQCNAQLGAIRAIDGEAVRVWWWE